MAAVTINDVYKIYAGGVTAVKGINLEIKPNEFLVLVGPSGCGKSTTLRMVAGLEEISKGEISINGRVVNNVPPKDRDIAMVFQNYALYPHMTVYDNMAFGLKLRKVPKADIDRRVRAAASVLGLDPYLERRPSFLSGGQRQRVAMGRAIVREPAVYLFDEPLSNLDAKMRVEMRKEILHLHKRVNATMIYVTHDQVEAMTLGDRIVVMKDGLIEQVADPSTVFDKPATLFVARFIGTPPMNIFDGVLRQESGKLVFDGGAFKIAQPPHLAKKVESHIGKKVSFGVRPRAFKLKSEASEEERSSSFKAKVDVLEPLGDEVLVHLVAGSHQFLISVGSHQKPELDSEIEVCPQLRLAHVFDTETGKNLTS